MSSERAVPEVASGPSAPSAPSGPVRADAPTGRLYWRSLEELADDPQFLDELRREFPSDASRFEDPRGRREFLGLMGASLALAGLTACTKQPTERIVPYVRPPADLVLGRPLFFATSLTLGGFGRGVLVESHENRPTKVEGNPDHPESLGGTDVFAQAEVLSLYDPDRLKTVRHLGEEESFANFAAAVRAALDGQRAKRGSGLRVVSATTTSPTLAAQLDELLGEFPEARVVSFEPVNRDNTRAGAVMAFGEPLEVQYHLAAADVVLSIDADFVGASPSAPRLIREFTSRRRIEAGAGAEGLNRLYAVETTPSLTGGVADHRLAVPPSEVAGLLRALAKAVGVAVGAGSTPHESWAQVVARDLLAHGPASLVMVGEPQPPEAHALAHLINQALGAVGRTVTFAPPAEYQPGGQLRALTDLVADMKARRVALLLVLGGNPAFDAPADLGFADAMETVPLRVHLTLDENETSERCHWQIPAAHPLEAWSDVRSADGTLSIVQPLIAPLYGGKSVHEILALLSKRPGRTGYDLVRERWSTFLAAADFDRDWRRVLHDGLLAGSAFPAKAATANLGEWAMVAPEPALTTGYEVVFRPDPTIWDGRYSNNGWLQELPKPLTKLTWDNTALISPRTARTLGIEIAHTARGHYTDVVSVRLGDRSLSLPAWILPGQPDGVVTLHLGYGRTKIGRVGRGAGVNTYPLRTSQGLWAARGLDLRKSGEQARLACTQDHWSIDQPEQVAARERHLVRSATQAEYRADPDVFEKMGAEPKKGLSLYPERPSEGHAWGLSIDLNSCVGCNACVVACQSENNIPVVGKEQVARGREMHWIRLDRYYRGSAEAPDAVFHQPVMCMHCENAPCEVVCPVTATVHSPEGLNEMVYNRCVGTRYCSNNCPYKVRRFNFLLYQDFETESLKPMRNPDVTVRSRGVMEKCTYCVQRIEHARIDAKNEGRDIQDGDIRTACEQACPAQAIVFGDVRDEKSRVAVRKAGGRDYGLVTELQTRPRTTYLASVRNPNPELRNG